MRRPKILYVATEDWYFVSDTLPLAMAAHDKGYHVCVAARANDKADIIRSAGLEFHPLNKISRGGTGLVSEPRSIAELTQLYRMLAPDLVHHIALKPILYGALAARSLPRTALINSVMGLGYVFTSQAAKARVLRPLMSGALRVALSRPRSRTLVQNKDDLEAVARLSPGARSKLRLVRGSGVDPAKFSPTSEPSGVPVVVLPARLLRDKGVEEFVAAARRLKASGIEARFALVGEPDADNPASVTQGEIDKWVAEGTIEHWGFRSDMPNVYREATIVCLPSYREGLPRVLLEAAASGRAVVTTDVPGCRDVVSNGVNGWLARPRDVDTLADALRSALTDSVLRARYVAEGRRQVEEHYAANIIIAQTLAIYEELLHALN
ncbi:MAG: glycosyltransferase family 4 protein [Hyphomicrobiaceae bacterium]|nr:glycosyltransferase family 4 protein [Hyphomicrobiaceae bacterium]